MNKLTRQDLLSLESYAEQREAFRAKVIEHKKLRRVAVGPHATLHFEDRLTMQYQVQEMLRIERIFEAAGIEEELAVYNPLIPDGRNWKATFMVEYSDVEERREMLAKLIGVERALYMQVEGFERIHPIANEDLERTTEEKTSAVHFVRFELNDAMAEAAKEGAAIHAGIDHAAYNETTTLNPEQRDSLAADLD